MSYHILGEYDESILLLRDKTQKFEVESYGKDLLFKWSKELDIPERNPKMIAVSSLEESFVLFYHFRKKGDVFIKFREYDSKSEVLDTGTVAIFENTIFTPKFDFQESEDQKSILIFDPYKNGSFVTLAYNIENKQLLWENTFDVDQFTFQRDFRDIVFTNDGHLFVVLEKRDVLFKKDNNKFELFHVHSENPPFKFEYILEDFLNYHAIFSFDNVNNNLVIGGLYAEDNLIRSYGFYSFSAPLNDLENFKTTSHSFSEKNLIDIYGKEIKKNKGIANIEIRDIVFRQDGGYLLIAEIIKEFSRGNGFGENRYYRNSVRNNMVDYYYEDLLCLSFHPDGEFHWANVFHKKQYSHDDRAIYSSYFIFKNPSKLRLVYNDDINREGTVSEYIINGDGDFVRNSVMNTEYQSLLLRFRDAVQTSPFEIIVPSQKNTKLNLVKINYQ
jgi:hypothetical protein